MAAWRWQAGTGARGTVCRHHSANAAAGRQTCAAESECLCTRQKVRPRPCHETSGVDSAAVCSWCVFLHVSLAHYKEISELLEDL